MKKVMFASALALTVTGCAVHETYQPVVDRQADFNAAKYQKDLGECRRYAAQVNPQNEAVTGAILGALVTAASVALTLDTGDYLARSAGVGAAAGAFQGAAGAANTQRAVIQRCLNGRGYSVLR